VHAPRAPQTPPHNGATTRAGEASPGGALNFVRMTDNAPFIAVVRDVVRERAGALAVDELSYAELWQQTGRVAHQIAERGVTTGERVAIFSENRRGFVLTYLACLRLGAIAVPTNVLYRAADFGNILSDAEPLLVVGSAQTRPHVPAGVPFIDAAEVESWARDPAFDADPPIAVTADDVAIIIYTSGTTGRAKGAMITHGNLAAIARQIGAAWRWTAADTLLITLPLFHVHGLGAGLNGTLAHGAHAILRERFDVNDVAALLQSGEVTMFFGVPTMYVRFIEKLPAQTFGRVRLFVSGSAALPADVHIAFEAQFGASILERYGSTEFGFPLGNRYDGPRVVGSVGVPMSAENHVTIVAPGTLDRVPDGEVGELLVSGPNVSAGYWRRPEATADAYVMLDGRRWFRSGDLFRFDPERGVYVVMGRLKELIISGGFNIYPLEVEAEMRLQPGVRDVALVAMPDPARGELPVAFVEAESGFDSEAFLSSLRERLASFKVPKAVHIVEALPRNAMGKVEKQRLIASFTQPAGAGTS
jgi:malonyl-CoA/methylmalonyl-CoA synthetase